MLNDFATNNDPIRVGTSSLSAFYQPPAGDYDDYFGFNATTASHIYYVKA